ncbi:hypothetical protein KNV66_gp40 [Bacillus phage DLc1]|uniref:Uncharacterized protein n=1 Tax=Bacillus phage DLc1 TaxID=2777318 RepID=A0A7M1RPC6_9CAUD|nr:hypothetical protein KNV66_gp40 [Bacillus phage DLc1]QOR56263.1 hypothetical protein [Bacillus phage DLc1]
MKELDWYNVAVLGGMYVEEIILPYNEWAFQFTKDIKRAKKLNEGHILQIRKHLSEAEIRMVKVELV